MPRVKLHPIPSRAASAREAPVQAQINMLHYVQVEATRKLINSDSYRAKRGKHHESPQAE